MKKRLDAYMQHGKKPKLQVSGCFKSSHFKFAAKYLSAPYPQRQYGSNTVPCSHGPCQEGSLTCELHSAVILIPLPWSSQHANQKVGVASADFSPALSFLCLRRFGMQKSQSRSPSSASLSVQLLGSSWTIAALRSLAFPRRGWDAHRPPCKQWQNLPGMGRRFIFSRPKGGWGSWETARATQGGVEGGVGRRRLLLGKKTSEAEKIWGYQAADSKSKISYGET